MAKLLFFAALVAAASAVTNAAQLNVRAHHHKVNAPAATQAVGTWSDLFSPPYAQCPSVMMAISCLSPTNCYVPGGSNGAGFQLLKFNGQPGGSFTPMNMPSEMLMMMAIDVRGSPTQPGGAVGGMGFGNGLQYLANSTTWLPSTIAGELMEVTQDIRASPDGKRILGVDVGGTSDVWYSTNSGKNFTTYKLGVPFVTSTTTLRYAAIPSPHVWYITAGTWPNTNNNGFESERSKRVTKDRVVLSARVAVTRDPTTGKVRREVRKIHKQRLAAPPAPVATQSGYSAQIFKTNDGGKTFSSVFAQTTNFYFNAIDCIDVKQCYAVGEGFDAGAGVHIYATKDGGASWSQVFSLPSTSEWSYSLMSIGVSRGTIIAAGGAEGISSQSLIITSTDGVTWTQQTPLPNIVDISDLDVIPGGYAFATAMTIYDDSTILAYTPPGAPTLPPVPTQATFTQTDCSDAKCSQGCSSNSFPQNSCLQLNGGGSAVAFCSGNSLVQQIYANNNGCQGNFTSSVEPLNTCLAANGGGYFENTCN